MSNRLDLHKVLLSICPHVYYQPPESVKMIYPCIVYFIDGLDPQYADNNPYLLHNSYSMRYITKDPDDPLIKNIALLPKCRFNQHYAKDNLHHYAYKIYY